MPLCYSDPYVRISVVGGEHAGPGVKKTSVVKKVKYCIYPQFRRGILLRLQIHCKLELPVVVVISAFGSRHLVWEQHIMMT